MTGVHQVVAGAAPRDAITWHALAAQDVFRSHGLRSNIYSDYVHTAPELCHRILPYESWLESSRQDDVALVHYSISSPAFDFIAERSDRLAVQYHNITPADLLWRFNPALALICKEGRERLSRMKERVVGASAISRFNAMELDALGFRDVAVTGLLRRHAPHGSNVPRQLNRRPRLLFVGRGVPNKAQHDLILAVAALRQAGVLSELRLVGSWGGNRAYLEHCRRLIARLQLQENVLLLGSISDAALDAEYSAADIFLCLSDHEGFCAPLMEAMERDVPIVAFGAGAVAETVGGGGLILTEKTPSIVAEAVISVLSDDYQVDPAGRSAALATHSPDRVAERLMAWVSDVSR